jgi:hypothetical protein
MTTVIVQIDLGFRVSGKVIRRLVDLGPHDGGI